MPKEFLPFDRNLFCHSLAIVTGSRFGRGKKKDRIGHG